MYNKVDLYHTNRAIVMKYEYLTQNIICLSLKYCILSRLASLSNSSKCTIYKDFSVACIIYSYNYKL